MMLGMMLKDKEVSPVYVKGDLEECCKLIGCSSIEAPCRAIGGRRMTIICDEEGLLKKDLRTSAVCDDACEKLVGTLIILGLPDSDGNLTELKVGDINAANRAIDDDGVLHYSIRS